MNLDEFKQKFSQIKEQGFIPTARKGPTGVGHTLEKALGLQENNIALPDIENVEIKAHRDNASNLITLFTFNRNVWKMKPLEAIREYGSKDKNGRLGLYYTMKQKPNSAGLFLHVETKTISVKHISGEVIACWNLEHLTEKFLEKIPALLFVSARVEERDGKEYFEYYRAQILRETKTLLLRNLFISGDILVDLRLHDKGTSARNHGTGFRVPENKLPKLFNKIEDI